MLVFRVVPGISELSSTGLDPAWLLTAETSPGGQDGVIGFSEGRIMWGRSRNFTEGSGELKP